MRDKVDDKEDAAWSETVGQLLSREGAIVHVVEAEAYACEVEVEEIRGRKLLGGGVIGGEEVSDACDAFLWC